jgi:hypothetical protein
MPNPLIAQGSLNRVRGSLLWPANNGLNVTAPYLTKAGMRLAFQGETTVYLPTMTGAVTSQEPYMMFELAVNLVKSNGLAQLYKAQMETNSALGDGTLRPDTASLSPFSLVNCSIRSVREVDISGEDPAFAIMIGGYYLVNSALFDAV